MLAELAPEDWEPGERLMCRGLRRHLLAELFDGGPIERRMRRRAARRAAFKPKADIFEHDDTLVIFLIFIFRSLAADVGFTGESLRSASRPSGPSASSRGETILLP